MMAAGGIRPAESQGPYKNAQGTLFQETPESRGVAAPKGGSGTQAVIYISNLYSKRSFMAPGTLFCDLGTLFHETP